MANATSTERAGNSVVPRWHALYTRHQHEKAVSQALTEKGFEVYLPRYRTIHQWKDRRKELLLPLFPNYVFIHGGLNRMLNIVSTPGVHAVVSCGGRAAEITAGEIETIRRVVEGPLQVEPYSFLKCGDMVRVKSGPLQGIEGILVRRGGGLRLVLTVEMLSQAAAVEIDASLVEQVRPN